MLIKSETETKLDAEIRSAIEALASHDKKSEEYATIVKRISELHKLKTEERPKQISPDTVLVVVANLVGILWMTTFERERPITSKAIGFVLKPRER